MQTAITHSNRDDKNFIDLTWTAPSAGTGALVFRYVSMHGNNKQIAGVTPIPETVYTVVLVLSCPVLSVWLPVRPRDVVLVQ